MRAPKARAVFFPKKKVSNHRFWKKKSIKKCEIKKKYKKKYKSIKKV